MSFSFPIQTVFAIFGDCLCICIIRVASEGSGKKWGYLLFKKSLSVTNKCKYSHKAERDYGFVKYY